MTSTLLSWSKPLIAIALVAWLLGRIDSDSMLQEILQIDPFYLLAALLLLVPNLAFQAMKWGTLLRSPHPEISRSAVWQSMLAGMTLGSLTPGRVGEHARILHFPKGTRTELAALSMLDKLASSTVTTLFGSMGLMLLPAWDLSIFGNIAGIILFALALYAALILAWALGSLLLLLTPRRVANLANRIKPLAKTHRFQRIRTALHGLSRRTRLQLLLAAIAFYSTFIAQFLLLLKGLGFAHPLSAAAASGTMFLKSLFPISLGDLGVRELFAANLFEGIGAAPELAIGAALLLFVINVLLPALLGSYFVSKRLSE
jgi:uncharacterized protein (TIRG00374 family)